MKTNSNSNGKFPKPFKFAMYLAMVTVIGFLNYMSLSANDPGYTQEISLEDRLSEALVPVADPEIELEDWILTFSNQSMKDIEDSKISLETRLADALQPVEDPEPEIEEWMLTFSETYMEEFGE